ncbi:MAG: hypothetical protein WCI36_00675 [bacterium]
MEAIVTLFELTTELELSLALIKLDKKVEAILSDDKLRFEQYPHDENPFYTNNANLRCNVRVEDVVTILQNKILIIRKISV